MTQETGGPAFPVQEQRFADGELSRYAEDGMTLRDYFAAKALAGFCANHICQPTTQVHYDNLAMDSYRAADAMLKVRGKTQ